MKCWVCYAFGACTGSALVLALLLLNYWTTT
jgi:hypothetical protein